MIWSSSIRKSFGSAGSCFGIGIRRFSAAHLRRSLRGTRARPPVASGLGLGCSAAMHLDALIKAQPGQWRLHSRRGRAYARLGRWNEAVADYSQAIALRPAQDALWKYEQPFNGRADGYAEMGRWEEAASDFLKACELDPRNAQARIGLGLISLARNDTKSFRDHCGSLASRLRPVT